jgi:GDP-L-fucose synthase
MMSKSKSIPMKNKVLVLGGTGLLGSSIDCDFRATRQDADLTDYAQVYKLLRRESPDWVINCAGKVGGVQANMNYKMDFFYQNMQINMNVIKACMELGIMNLISFSSTCVFPDWITTRRRLVEKDIHKGKPHRSNYPYAYSKRMVEVMSRIAREQGFNYSVLIPTNLYGINDNFDLQTSHVVPALIRKFHEALIKFNQTGETQEVHVWGDGSPLREFLYVNDLNNIVHHIIDNDIKLDNVIVSPSVSHSIKDVVNIIIAAMVKFRELDGCSVFKVVYDTEKPNGQYVKNTDNRVYQNKIGLPFTPFRLGLTRVINDYVINKSVNNGKN